MFWSLFWLVMLVQNVPTALSGKFDLIEVVIFFSTPCRELRVVFQNAIFRWLLGPRTNPLIFGHFTETTYRGFKDFASNSFFFKKSAPEFAKSWVKRHYRMGAGVPEVAVPNRELDRNLCLFAPKITILCCLQTRDHEFSYRFRVFSLYPCSSDSTRDPWFEINTKL